MDFSQETCCILKSNEFLYLTGMIFRVYKIEPGRITGNIDQGYPGKSTPLNKLMG